MARLSCFLSSLFLFLSVANVLFANTATISLEGVRRGSGTTANGLVRKAGVVDLQNNGDLEYYTNVTLGGRSFRVLLDGRSADLWVAGKVPNSTVTPHVVTIHYGDAYALGKVNTAALRFAGVTIVNQSYVEQAIDSSHPEGQGILGIGASRLSSILSTLSAPAGNTVIDNLIKVEGTGSNFVTSLVSRPADGSSTISAQLTIGEVDSDHMDVQSAVQLPVSKNGWDSHWLVSLDDGGIIGPDKLMIRASKVNQLKVVFDSGYTMSQVPEAIAAAIYSRVPGAKLATIDASPSPVWTLPCDFELNITFKFGGVAYPIHPLDTVMRDIAGPADDQGSATCVGAFQPTNASNPYDILLGMTFLRNAYILMNLGDQPYVQLRSLTEPAQAHLDFVQQRLSGVDTTGSQQLLNDSAGLSDNSTPTSPVDKNRVLIVAGTVIGTFVLLGAAGIIAVWYHKRRYRRLHAVTLQAALPSDPAETSPTSKESKDPEPKSTLRIPTLPVFVYSRHKSGPAMPGQLPSLREKSRSAITRETSERHLKPNRESSKTQNRLTVSGRSSTGAPTPPGVETASLLDNAAAPGVKPVSCPESPKDRQSVYTQEDGPILIIGLPIPTSDVEEDRRPPSKSATDSAEVFLGSSEARRRLTSWFGVTLPSTPATLKSPARADTPNPYDLPLFSPPTQLAASSRPRQVSPSRPLPNPHTMPGNRRDSRVTISAFESLFGRPAFRRSKRSPVPPIDTSALVGRGTPSLILDERAIPGSELKKSSRTFSFRSSRGKP